MADIQAVGAEAFTEAVEAAAFTEEAVSMAAFTEEAVSMAAFTVDLLHTVHAGRAGHAEVFGGADRTGAGGLAVAVAALHRFSP